MKRLLAMLLTLAMVLQIGGAGLALAEDAEQISIIIKDENGEELYNGTLTEENFFSKDIPWNLEGSEDLSEELLAAIEKATNISLEGKVLDIYAQGNPNGDPVTVSVKGNVVYVQTYGDSAITVVGDIQQTKENYSNPAIFAGSVTEYESDETIENESTIVIDGNVAAYDMAIYAEDSAEITVNGDVTSGHEDDSRFYGGNAVDVTDSAKVEITGDLTSVHGRGILTRNEEEYNPQTYSMDEVSLNDVTVVVGGDITAYAHGIEANGNATITVDGSITAGSIHEYPRENDNTSQYGYGDGVLAEESANVAVSGDINSANAGVVAHDEAKVTVGGDITSGSYYHYYEPNERDPETGEVSYFEAEGYQGPGVSVDGQATVTVDGSVTSQAEGIFAGNSSDYQVTNGMEDGIWTSVRVSTDITGEASVDVAGDVTSENEAGVYATGKNDVHVGGDVTGATGISAWGSAQVTVDGDVTSADGNGIEVGEQDLMKLTTTETYDYNTSEGPYYVDEEEVIGTLDGAVVVVGGDVTSAGTAINAHGNVTVIVGGDVTSEEGVGIDVYPTYTQDEETGEWLPGDEAPTVMVAGDVTAEKETAIYMAGNSDVVVWGDVTGGWVKPEEESEYEPTVREKALNAAADEAFKDVELGEWSNGAVYIDLQDEENDGQLIVGGTIQVNDGADSVPLVLTYSVDDATKAVEIPDLPEIKIYEIAPEDGTYFDVNIQLSREIEYSWTDEETGETESATDTVIRGSIELSEEDHTALIESIAKAIQYIIKIDEALSNGSVNIADQFYDSEYGIYTAHEGEEVKITINPDEGYQLDGVTATGNYTLAQNADGSWTLTVQRGGGVTVSAIINKKAVAAAANTKHPAVGKIAESGKYDLDGDGVEEELKWQVLSVVGGYARIAMVEGVPEITDELKAGILEIWGDAIRNNEIIALDKDTAKRLFGDDLVHPSMYVKLETLNLGE